MRSSPSIAAECLSASRRLLSSCAARRATRSVRVPRDATLALGQGTRRWARHAMRQRPHQSTLHVKGVLLDRLEGLVQPAFLLLRGAERRRRASVVHCCDKGHANATRVATRLREHTAQAGASQLGEGRGGPPGARAGGRTARHARAGYVWRGHLAMTPQGARNVVAAAAGGGTGRPAAAPSSCAALASSVALEPSRAL